MTHPISEKKLDVAALLEGTTPGPWIADDFCEDDDQATRLGTTDGTPHYYHRTTTLAYFQVTDADDVEHGEPVVGIVAAEKNARLAAAAPRLAAEHIALTKKVDELEAALRPFADYADPRCLIPETHKLTAGSSMARQQLTMGDCYKARTALNDTTQCRESKA